MSQKLKIYNRNNIIKSKNRRTTKIEEPNAIKWINN